jgi:hypothetical protein
VAYELRDNLPKEAMSRIGGGGLELVLRLVVVCCACGWRGADRVGEGVCAPHAVWCPPPPMRMESPVG